MQINFFFLYQPKGMLTILLREYVLLPKGFKSQERLGNSTVKTLLSFFIILNPEKFQLMMEEASHWYSYCQVKRSKLE